jgi:hypothetical protein
MRRRYTLAGIFQVIALVGCQRLARDDTASTESARSAPSGALCDQRTLDAIDTWNARLPDSGREETEGPMAGFSRSKPIGSADPAVRQSLTVAVPTDILIRRQSGAYTYTLPASCFSPQVVSVGKDMLLSWKWSEFHVERGPAESEAVTHCSDALGSLHVGDELSVDLRSAQNPDKKFALRIRFTLFETDIPPEHMWSPERGKYRVLWTGDVTKDIQ